MSSSMDISKFTAREQTRSLHQHDRYATFLVSAGSAQVVPDPTTTAVQVQCAAFNQRPEVLFQRIATGAHQPDDFAHSDDMSLPPG